MADDGPILVTGAAGKTGSVGRTVTGLLLDRGFPVRAMVRREDERAASLRAAGAQVVVGDLLEPGDVYRVISGCGRVYFSMSPSAGYLEASVTMAARSATAPNPATTAWCLDRGRLRIVPAAVNVRSLRRRCRFLARWSCSP